MTPTLRRKLLALAERHEELQHLLADPVIVGDNNRFRDLSREYAQLQPVADALASEAAARQDLQAAQAMATDPELAGLAEEEISAAQQRLQQLDGELALLLWQNAGRPEPAALPAFADAADTETAKAAQWCTEQGLLTV